MSEGYAARVILDSLHPDGMRLATMEVTFPKFILAEFNTHRIFSRNSASSRAIPFDKMVQRVIENPVMPVWWGKNQAGMQAAEEIVGTGPAIGEWLAARDEAVARARRMAGMGLHKQIVNRLLEPWLFTTVIVSSTDYGHFFNLRCHPDAQPEMRHTAELMREAYRASTPTALGYWEWHMPYVRPEDRDWAVEVTPDPAGTEYRKFMASVCSLLGKVSVARCARVSYLTHDGKRDPQADIDLHDRLATSGHWSPFEHVAQAVSAHHAEGIGQNGNFCFGWRQYRKTFDREFMP